MATVPLLKVDGLARSFMGDLKSTVSPRILNKTVRDYLTAKGLPTLSVAGAADPDIVRNWIKAFPASYTDAARGFTASTMQFCRDIFSHFKDMSPAYPWRGVSVQMVRNALNVLAVDLKATNSLTDLADYAAQNRIQRPAAFMLLRVILDDLHGDNAEAQTVAAAGSDYPVLVGAPTTFHEAVLAYAKRAAPWAFDVPTGAASLSVQSGASSAKRAASPLGSDEEIIDPPQRQRRSKTHSDHSSRALMAQLGLTSKTRLSGTNAVDVLVEACDSIEAVSDVDNFVTAFYTLSRHVSIRTNKATDMSALRVELFASGLFQAVERQLGGPISESALNDNLLAVLRTVVSKAEDAAREQGVIAAVRDLQLAAQEASDRIKIFATEASKQTNFDRLRNSQGRGFIAWDAKDQALQAHVLEQFLALDRRGSARGYDRDRDRGRDRGADRDRGRDRGRDYDRDHDRRRDRGGDRDRDRDKQSHPLVDKLIRHLQGKKNMPRFKARQMAMDIADRRCLGCRAQMVRGDCADRCRKTEVHADMLAKVPAEIAKLG